MTPQLAPELDDLLKRVFADWTLAEKLHAPWRKDAEHHYNLFRTYKQFRAALTGASARDKDGIISDGRSIWGEDLHIPYAFSTVETILAQMLAHRPRMLVTPRDEDALGNVDNMAALIDSQQERIHYELILQDVGKDGLITGMGWQKIYWETVTRSRTRLKPRILMPSQYKRQTVTETEVDDWTAEHVDPFRLRWDPYAGEVDACSFIIHQIFMDERKVRARVESGAWTLPAGWTIDDLLGVGRNAKAYSEAYAPRNAASGYGTWDNKQGSPYEVWEYHDGDRVITILGRAAVVQVADNPCWGGKLPFQVYRPTTAANGMLMGIGEIEPLEHLIREMDELRTQRRHNAALVLHKVLAYHTGVVDPDDIKFGPGMLIGVNGDPNELLREIEVSDIKASGYKEEERLEANIERTSGISDPITGGGAANGTATEAQLVRAAANTRIQNKARRIEVEIIQTGGEYAVELNQQKILENRMLQVPLPPQPYEAERRWAWRAVKPSELMGKMAIRVEGGSTMAENVPQMRQDGMQLMNLFGNHPQINQRRILEESLKKYGFHDPTRLLAPEKPVLSPGVLQKLAEAGVDPQLIDAAIQADEAQQPPGGQVPPPNDGPDPNLQMAQAGG